MVIFVGKELNGGFIKEFLEKDSIGEKVEFIKPQGNIVNQTSEIIMVANKGCKAIIYDVDEYNDDAEILIAEILKVKKATGAVPILLTHTSNPNNVLMIAAWENGIKRYIDASKDMTSLKEQLSLCISGYYEKEDHPGIVKVKKEQEKRKLLESKYRTIGVVGAIHRVGTTTQALQITKFLIAKGYKACYVEMNNRKYKNIIEKLGKGEKSYVEKTKLFYDPTSENEELGYILLDGIDMYYKPEKLASILEKEYDFYIYDYGTYTDLDFNKASYLKDNINIFVSGTGVTEMDYNIDIFSNTSYIKSKFIFSFIAENDIKNFMESMANYNVAKRSYFAKFTPNPFVLSDIELYENVLSEVLDDNKKIEVEKDELKPSRKKFGLFTRKKARKK